MKYLIIHLDPLLLFLQIHQTYPLLLKSSCVLLKTLLNCVLYLRSILLLSLLNSSIIINYLFYFLSFFILQNNFHNLSIFNICYIFLIFLHLYVFFYIIIVFIFIYMI